MNRRTLRVPDDNGLTRRNYVSLDSPALNEEDWHQLSIIHGATGNPRGRPPKSGKPKVRTEADGPFLYGYEQSTKADWERERNERLEAMARVEARKRGRKYPVGGKAIAS